MAFRAAPAAAMTFRTAPAHRAVLARVLAASRVERRPEPPDASYLRDLVARLYIALARLFERAGGRLGLPWWLLPGIAGVGALPAPALLARARRARRRRAAASGSDTAAAPDVAA